MVKVIWISDYPLLGSSFGRVTFTVTRMLEDYDFHCLSLGYRGLPLRLDKNIHVYPLKRPEQLEYYFRKIEAEKLVVFHSFYLLEQMKEYPRLFRGEKIVYIPIETDEVAYKYISLFDEYDRIIVPSAFSMRALRKVGLKAKVVPHGVEREFFVPSSKKHKEFRFGYLGLNDVRKQVPRVMRAYSRLGKGMLVLATPMEGYYDLFSLSKVLKISPIFVRPKLDDLPMPEENVRDFYQSLDVYVSPASEAFGLPALEAQACGVPVIASSHGASPEVLGRGALYVKVNEYLETNIGRVGLVDIYDLYIKMKTLLEVERIREKVRREAERNVKRYDWSRVAKTLRRVLG